MRHCIPENCKNSEIVALIDEYVRTDRDKAILKDHWFGGLTFEQLAEKYELSVTRVKDIVYKIGDKILLKLK